MSNVYFAKMNAPEEVVKKVYKTADRGFLGDIEIGDYAFIKLEKETSPASIKRLWKLREIRENHGIVEAVFDEVFEFEAIPLLQFEALNFFVLDMNLLNKCNKQTKGLSFYKLSIVDEKLFKKAIASKVSFEKYIKNDENYRKIVVIDTVDDIDLSSKDLQFYNENDSWELATDVPFIGEDLKDNYDASQFDLYDKYGKKGSNTAKDKMFGFLSGMDVEPALMGVWDLFCGNVNVKVNSDASRSKTVKRDDFIEYCKSQGVKRAAAQYEAGIRSIEKTMSVDVDEEFARDRCKSLIDGIKEYISSISDENLGNMRNWHIYVKKYIEYKDSLIVEDQELSEDIKTENSGYSYDNAKHNGINKVFYGTPGCGKSYYVENAVLVMEEVDDNNVFRTTFFQDYSNTDFVGQVYPQIDADGSVTYEFVPGPFTKALKCAIDNPDGKVALVIEELNRGNAPSIFGDLFQLLDRKNGESRYKIVNVNIQNYLKKESTYDLDYIKIPRNLYIYATMNTSDQNVFTLDTAFKRRWYFEKLTNEFLGKDTIGSKYVPGFKAITWKAFVERINRFIIEHATTLSAEDKQIGKYFIEEEYLLDSLDDYQDDKQAEFAYKVFEYLWSDVAKFNRSDWFVGDVKSLDILLYKFMSHQNVFVQELAVDLPVYIPDEVDG